MKVLVTGGAGLIGSHLVDRLLTQEHQVVVLDNLSTGRKGNIHHNLGNQDFVFLGGSILDSKMVVRAAADCDVIFHLAAAVGVGNIVANPLQSILINMRGTENVFQAASETGTKVLFASTSEIYGKSTKLPFSEDDDRVLGPTTISRWSYSTAKALGEHLALAYAEQGLPVSIVRYFNSYGPRTGLTGYGGVIGRFISQAIANQPLTIYGDGEQTRCFCFVDDTVEGTFLAATRKEGTGEIFNIGGNAETSIVELARKVIQITGSSSEIVHLEHKEIFGARFEDIRHRIPDVSKAERLLGFKARTTLEEGLRKTFDWMVGKVELAD